MWEICDVAEKLNDTVNEVRSIVKEAGISLFLSTIRNKKDQEKATGKYHHMIVHGFSPLDKEMITQIAKIDDVSGIVFRIDGETSPWLAVQSVFDLIQKHGLKASLHIRMSKGSPGWSKLMIIGTALLKQFLLLLSVKTSFSTQILLLMSIGVIIEDMEL